MQNIKCVAVRLEIYLENRLGIIKGEIRLDPFSAYVAQTNQDSKGSNFTAI